MRRKELEHGDRRGLAEKTEKSAQRAARQPRHFFSVASVTPLRPPCWRLVLVAAIRLHCVSVPQCLIASHLLLGVKRWVRAASSSSLYRFADMPCRTAVSCQAKGCGRVLARTPIQTRPALTAPSPRRAKHHRHQGGAHQDGGAGLRGGRKRPRIGPVDRHRRRAG